MFLFLKREACNKRGVSDECSDLTLAHNLTSNHRMDKGMLGCSNDFIGQYTNVCFHQFTTAQYLLRLVLFGLHAESSQ